MRTRLNPFPTNVHAKYKTETIWVAKAHPSAMTDRVCSGAQAGFAPLRLARTSVSPTVVRDARRSPRREKLKLFAGFFRQFAFRIRSGVLTL